MQTSWFVTGQLFASYSTKVKLRPEEILTITTVGSSWAERLKPFQMPKQQCTSTEVIGFELQV